MNMRSSMLLRNEVSRLYTFARLAGLTFLLSVTLAAQDAAKDNDELLRTWQHRVTTLREGIEKDLFRLSDLDRSLYNALLARSFHLYEPERSIEFLNRSRKAINAASDEESNFVESENSRKVSRILEIIYSIDSELGAKTAEELFERFDAKSSKNQNVADILVTLGIQTAPRDPAIAHSFGVLSLAKGRSSRFNQLVGELLLVDPDRAEQLYAMGLASARSPFNYTFVGGLNISFSTYRGRQLSGNARKGYFNLLSSMMREAGSRPESRSELCPAAPLVTQLLPRFEEDFPVESAGLRQLISVCLSYVSAATQAVTSRQAEASEPRSFEDLVRQAREANDKILKSRFYYLALQILEREERFSDAIDLLDSMEIDERKAIGELSWDGWRSEYTTQACVQSFRSGDLPKMFKTIADTPIRLRPYVRTGLIFAIKNEAEAVVVLEQLTNIRKEATNASVTSKDAAISLLAILRVYRELNPTELSSVFNESTAAINRADRDNPQGKAVQDFAPLQETIKLPIELLEQDEIGTLNRISELSNPLTRIRLRFGLLDASIGTLEKVRSATQQTSSLGSK